MPLNVRMMFATVLLSLFGTIAFISAQAPQASQTVAAQPASPLVNKPPTSAEVMRERISKAKAYIAVRNYNAAIYELENIRRETGDTSVNAVTNVLLMNSYLEQGDYKRAQDFLNEFFKSYKSNSASGNLYYAAVAAQVIKGARNQVERYRSLGLNVGDRNLPLEAVNDIERMRETVELVITQAKDLGSDKVKSSAAMALLEEATNSRSMIARDDYDARRWRDALGDSREQIAGSQSVVISAIDGTAVASPTPQNAVAVNMPSTQNTVAMNTSQPTTQNASTTANNSSVPVLKPVPTATAPQTKSEGTVAANNKPAVDQPRQPQTQIQQPVTEPLRPRVNENKPSVEVAAQTPVKAVDTAAAAGPMMEVGSLITYATKQQAPIYPPAAKNMRTTGVVKVEVMVDETGKVTEVQKMSGPMLLQAAAKDAIRKWTFRPFMRDGQPVKAVGFVNFNFSL
jgi:TonB family protein